MSSEKTILCHIGKDFTAVRATSLRLTLKNLLNLWVSYAFEGMEMKSTIVAAVKIVSF